MHFENAASLRPSADFNQSFWSFYTILFVILQEVSEGYVWFCGTVLVRIARNRDMEEYRPGELPARNSDTFPEPKFVGQVWQTTWRWAWGAFLCENCRTNAVLKADGDLTYWLPPHIIVAHWKRNIHFKKKTDSGGGIESCQTMSI